jgi:hypothetical protein
MSKSGSRVRYPQWRSEVFDTESGLESDKVNVVTKVGDEIWAGTESGISVFSKGDWQSKSGRGWPAGAVNHVCEYGEEVILSTEEGVSIRKKGKWKPAGGPADILSADVDGSGTLWACSQDGLWTYDGRGWNHEKRMSGGRLSLRDFACLSGSESRAAAATAHGVFFLQGKRLYWFGVHAKEEGLLSNDTRAVAQDTNGHVWVATDLGISIYGGGDGWCSLTGREKLPYEDLTSARLTPWGDYWFGSEAGLILLRDGRWKYLASKRWLPDDDLNDILPTGEGDVWAATDAGLSHITSVDMGLDEKAAHYEETVRRYHLRRGYVGKRTLTTPGDLESGHPNISDNDGLWTSLYIAAECFRFAVTKDDDAKTCARQSLDAMMKLESVTGISGFPARAIRWKGDPGFGSGHEEWHRSEDGELEWKSETSSDEVDGHFFALSAYFDLVATEDERTEIVEYTKRMMDHIVENGYYLIDLDGEPTTWGVWSPNKLNRDDRWRMQRGLNSLEILSHLKTAHHITGGTEYGEEYLMLAREEHYALNTVKQRIQILGGQTWHDDRLAYLAYYPLLIYEKDPSLRQIYLLSLERTWRQIRGQRNSLWNIMTSAMSGSAHDIESAVGSLAEYPLDLVDWTIKNSHRADVVPNPERPREATEPLPADERPVNEWASNIHLMDGGRNGLRALDGTWYLLPYWMGRYHSLIPA